MMILNSNTWRTDMLLLFYAACGFCLRAQVCLVGRSSDKTLCEIHCFCEQHVSPMTSKSEQIQSHHCVYIIDEV